MKKIFNKALSETSWLLLRKKLNKLSHIEEFVRNLSFVVIMNLRVKYKLIYGISKKEKLKHQKKKEMYIKVLLERKTIDQSYILKPIWKEQLMY